MHATATVPGLASALLLVTLSPLAAQIHVDASASPGGNGVSWATAYDSLQTALGAATSGQSVWVAAGSYTGGFSIPANVTVLGGFEPGMRRADQARPADHPTILTGGGTQRVANLGDDCVLDGFVLRDGNAGSPGGGGALINGVQATIRRCEFTNNRNSGGRGAALTVATFGVANVSDSTFHHNADTGHTIDVYTGGGGTFDHITVADNLHNGLHMQQQAICQIQNSIFVRNSGRGICDVRVGPANQPTLDNNLFWQNGVSLVHVTGTELRSIAAVNALSYATGNIAANPGFVGASDYRLTANSGAIDQGLPGNSARLDLGGMPRVTDGDLDGQMIRDLGAHEYNGCVLTASGSASAGSTLVLDVTAATNQAFGGVAMLLPGSTTTVAPFGTAFGGSPISAILGFLPGSLSVSIPSGFTADVVFQGFCFDPSTNGNLSNPLAFALQ
ncbi:MAG: right-handed parallel beta-helix repeat-containing protein [bacterium]|nr:right-handed parallel beta-helix repeat-containing protein [bacterium]